MLLVFCSISMADMVMLSKGDPEKLTGGKLMPRADGPYVILEARGAHNVVLGDPKTKEPILGGKAQTTAA